jgi:hypothetical protein
LSLYIFFFFPSYFFQRYELAGVRKEVSDAKQEIAALKVQEEAFAAEKRKWQYDEQQLKLQIESESHLVASANERAAKTQLEKDKLVASVAEVEAKLEQAVIENTETNVDRLFFNVFVDSTRTASGTICSRRVQCQVRKACCGGRKVAEGRAEERRFDHQVFVVERAKRSIGIAQSSVRAACARAGAGEQRQRLGKRIVEEGAQRLAGRQYIAVK